MLFDFLPATLQYLITSYLFAQTPTNGIPLKFSLRHELGVSTSSRLVFSDAPQVPQFAPELYSVDTKAMRIPRPRSQARFFSARMRGVQDELEWDETDVVGPDVEDRETLLMLAKMANNAYSHPGDQDWYDIGTQYNNVGCITFHSIHD